MKYFLGLGILVLLLTYASTFFVSDRYETIEVHPVKTERHETSQAKPTVPAKAQPVQGEPSSSETLETETKFSDWSSDAMILDEVHESWGEVLQEPFFNEERKEALLRSTKVDPKESTFLRGFKSGTYRGYVLLVPKSNAVALDPQPFIMSLKKENKTVKLDWVTWKKSTNADGSPYITIKEDYVSPFATDEPYTNTITLSMRSLTGMFLFYFGGPHDCKEGTIFISLERSKLPGKIEGDLFCRLSRENFILTGLVSMTLAP